MKLNPQLFQDIEKYKSYVIIVEGKKDVSSLKALGFQRVHAIHEPGVPIKVRMEQIAQQLMKKDKVCILTDFDKKGKSLYLLIKQIGQELGLNLDSSLRGLLLKAQVSHVEGLWQFIEKQRF